MSVVSEDSDHGSEGTDWDDVPLVIDDSEDDGAADLGDQPSQRIGQSDNKRPGISLGATAVQSGARPGPQGLPQGFSLKLPTDAAANGSSPSSSSAGRSPRRAMPDDPASARSSAGTPSSAPCAAVPKLQLGLDSAAAASSLKHPAAPTTKRSPRHPAPSAAAPTPPPAAAAAAAGPALQMRKGSPDLPGRGPKPPPLNLLVSTAGSPHASPRVSSASPAQAPGGAAAVHAWSGSLQQHKGAQPCGAAGSGPQQLQVVLLLPAFSLQPPEGAAPGAALTPQAVSDALRGNLGVAPAALQYYQLLPSSLAAALPQGEHSGAAGEAHGTAGSQQQQAPVRRWERTASRLQQRSGSHGGSNASSPHPQEPAHSTQQQPVQGVVVVSLPSSSFNLGSLQQLLSGASASNAEYKARAEAAGEAEAAMMRELTRQQLNAAEARADAQRCRLAAAAAEAARAELEGGPLARLAAEVEALMEERAALRRALKLERRTSPATTPLPPEPSGQAPGPGYMSSRRRTGSSDGGDKTTGPFQFKGGQGPGASTAPSQQPPPPPQQQQQPTQPPSRQHQQQQRQQQRQQGAAAGGGRVRRQSSGSGSNGRPPTGNRPSGGGRSRSNSSTGAGGGGILAGGKGEAAAAAAAACSGLLQPGVGAPGSLAAAAEGGRSWASMLAANAAAGNKMSPRPPASPPVEGAGGPGGGSGSSSSSSNGAAISARPQGGRNFNPAA